MESIISILLFVGFLYLMMKFGCGAHVHSAGCSHGSHHREKSGDRTTENTVGGSTATRLETLTRDPVCGMEFEVGRAVDSVEYGPKAFYLCSKDCLAKFKERPEFFVELERLETRQIA
jgi:YHS domain-containing protein